MKKNVMILFGMLMMASGLFAAPVAKKATRAHTASLVSTTIAALPAAKQIESNKAALTFQFIEDEPTTFVFATTCGQVVAIHSSGGMSDAEKLVYMIGMELAFCGE